MVMGYRVVLSCLNIIFHEKYFGLEIFVICGSQFKLS